MSSEGPSCRCTRRGGREARRPEGSGENPSWSRQEVRRLARGSCKGPGTRLHAGPRGHTHGQRQKHSRGRTTTETRRWGAPPGGSLVSPEWQAPHPSLPSQLVVNILKPTGPGLGEGRRDERSQPRPDGMPELLPVSGGRGALGSGRAAQQEGSNANGFLAGPAGCLCASGHRCPPQGRAGCLPLGPQVGDAARVPRASAGPSA